MRLLLDTHAFLWFIMGSSNLSVPARALVEDEANESFLSVASL
jgi:PIN domain nuclease of toxin-antitoxin system